MYHTYEGKQSSVNLITDVCGMWACVLYVSTENCFSWCESQSETFQAASPSLSFLLLYCDFFFCDHVSDFHFEIPFSFSDCEGRSQPSSEVCFLSSYPSFWKTLAPCRVGLPHVWIAGTQTGGSLPWLCIRMHCGALIKLVTGPHS